MHQSGLALPIRKGKLGYFKHIYIDVGDNQSLSDNLSTFSAHISQIGEIINAVGGKDLVLLDELGWGDRNVGAETPEDYGTYLAWGELEPKAEYNWESYKYGPADEVNGYNFADGRLTLKPEDDPATAEFGEGWRMPTYDEMRELYFACTWDFDTARNGWVLSRNDASIFLPLGGCKPMESEYDAPGAVGAYWTLSRAYDSASEAIAYYLISDNAYYDKWSRNCGLNVRPVYAPRVGVTGIALNKDEINTIPGTVHQLIVTIEPENATEQGILWSSSDENVAVVDAFGEVTILSEGTANIQAAAVDGSELATSCHITVTQPKDLTIYDGTATSGYVPIYGFYADAYLKCEMVYPATELTSVKNGTITGLMFYVQQEDVPDWGAQFQVFLMEVDNPSISSFYGTANATIVYEGHLSVSDKKLEIPFSTPYTYGGKNLLIGVYLTSTGSYKSSNWYGQTAASASVQGYSYSGLSDVGATQRDFLPKVTIHL